MTLVGPVYLHLEVVRRGGYPVALLDVSLELPPARLGWGSAVRPCYEVRRALYEACWHAE
jgi:hypothetical protein